MTCTTLIHSITHINRHSAPIISPSPISSQLEPSDPHKSSNKSLPFPNPKFRHSRCHAPFQLSHIAHLIGASKSRNTNSGKPYKSIMVPFRLPARTSGFFFAPFLGPLPLPLPFFAFQGPVCLTVRRTCKHGKSYGDFQNSHVLATL